MKSDNSKYFITGGGTGGHIYPAIAVADYLHDCGSKIYYVGNPKNLEFDIVQGKDYEFLPINIHGMPRKACCELIKWGIQLALAVIKCGYYLLKYKPDMVFGTGGYVSAPTLIAAKFLNIPFVMHDCDANPGLVTRSLAPYAKGVSLAFECAADYIHNENCYITGNPIRSGFKTLSKSDARKNLGLENKLTICIMGGSQGAKSINSAAVGILKTLSQKYDLQVIFQTGKKKFETVMDNLAVEYPDYELDKNLLIRPYFDDMVSVLKASDIAVSRAGSLSISELCASGIASIFVPYPHAAADHQRKNAKYMEECGAGLYLEDSDTNSQTLLEMLEKLMNNKDELVKIQKNALELAKYDAVKQITRELFVY